MSPSFSHLRGFIFYVSFLLREQKTTIKTRARSQQTMERTWEEIAKQNTELAIQGNFNEKIKREYAIATRGNP